MASSWTFDGSGDYLDYGDVTMFDGLSAATWSFWVKSTNFTTNGGYVAKYSNFDDGQSPFYIYDSSSTNLQMAVFGSSLNYRYKDCVHGMSTGIWYHVAISWDVSRNATDYGFEVYINGIKKTLTAGNTLGTVSTLVSGNASSCIGALRTNNLYKNGKLAHIKCFNRALTESEIIEIYNNAQIQLKGNIYYVPGLDSTAKELMSATTPAAGGNATTSSDGPKPFMDAGGIM